VDATIQHAIKRGVSWLHGRQSRKSGGWHSEAYGAFRGGASNSALVLYTASFLPKAYRESKVWERGLAFLSPGIDRRACVACPDGTLEFPTYASAMTLVASRRLGLPLTKDRQQKLVDYLVRAQLTTKGGFKANDPDFGGWDLDGVPAESGVTSGSNISVSLHAVEAIAAEAHALKPKVLLLATRWSHRCQNFNGATAGKTTGAGASDPADDGGFFFHPERDALGNKAEWSDKAKRHPRSYGTATCDGIHLLLAAGAKREALRVQAGLGWLRANTDNRKVPGFEAAPPNLGWDEGLKFYYFMGLSRVLKLLPEPVRTVRAKDLAAAVIALQREDGSWRNPSARMREDDELIASCFALTALSNLVELMDREK